MKISTFYLADISNYDNFIEKLVNDIDMQFYNKGYNSIYLTKLISYLRKEFSTYATFKFNKKTNVIILLPKIDTNLFEKEKVENKEIIYIRLNYDKIIDILNGKYYNYSEYISEIVSQFEDYIQEPEKENQFEKYLILQMDNLVTICINELLTNFSKKEIQLYLINSKKWIRLSRKSIIFKDYYKLYHQNKVKYEEMFTIFLKKIAKGLLK